MFWCVWIWILHTHKARGFKRRSLRSHKQRSTKIIYICIHKYVHTHTRIYTYWYIFGSIHVYTHTHTNTRAQTLTRTSDLTNIPRNRPPQSALSTSSKQWVSWNPSTCNKKIPSRPSERSQEQQAVPRVPGYPKTFVDITNFDNFGINKNPCIKASLKYPGFFCKERSTLEGCWVRLTKGCGGNRFSQILQWFLKPRRGFTHPHTIGRQGGTTISALTAIKTLP